MPDHVFADVDTAVLLASARVEPAPAEGKLSDHAPVIVELDVAVATGQDEVEGQAATDAVPPEVTRPSGSVVFEVIG